MLKVIETLYTFEELPDCDQETITERTGITWQTAKGIFFRSGDLSRAYPENYADREAIWVLTTYAPDAYSFSGMSPDESLYFMTEESAEKEAKKRGLKNHKYYDEYTITCEVIKY